MIDMTPFEAVIWIAIMLVFFGGFVFFAIRTVNKSNHRLEQFLSQE